MKKVFDDNGWEDYIWWQDHDRAGVRKINRLLADIEREPHDGMGHPEALRFSLAGFWSRRIDKKNRLVYQVNDEADEILIASCRHHYNS